MRQTEHPNRAMAVKRAGSANKARKPGRLVTWIALCLISLLILANGDSLLQFVYSLPYREEITQKCEENQIDAGLVMSVIYSESRFRPDAESAAGARGMMQIMPVTGAWIAERLGIEDYSADRLYEPALNISMGIWYMSWLEQQFDKEPAQVLAAYNAGPGNVKKWIEAEIWDGSQQQLENIPFNETRNYVQRILKQYANHQKYPKTEL